MDLASHREIMCDSYPASLLDQLRFCPGVSGSSLTHSQIEIILKMAVMASPKHQLLSREFKTSAQALTSTRHLSSHSHPDQLFVNRAQLPVKTRSRGQCVLGSGAAAAQTGPPESLTSEMFPPSYLRPHIVSQALTLQIVF